jgi:signal transduction histidine kinase
VQIRAPELSIRLDLDGLGDAKAMADEEATREVLANLLDNAARYARAEVVVAVTAKGRWIEMAVDDDGPGVPEGAAEIVFDRFVSLDKSGGAGLGLAIARGLARSEGGDVSYRDGKFVLHVPTFSISSRTLHD